MMAETSPSNIQFAGLVEAATAAAYHQHKGQGDSIHLPLSSDPVRDVLDDDFYSEQTLALRSDARPFTLRKRKRGLDAEGLVQGQYNTTGDFSSRSIMGVPSTSALFRESSSKGKKYTRPPMSKVFSSLELSPENFLQLQAEAKAYMLDDRCPERRDCVGQRGRGDTDLVRLKLWKCTKEFLDDLGNGKRFFAEHMENAGPLLRNLCWPRDAPQIIKRCVPLLRRMVTNERQRQYALQSRKLGTDASTEAHSGEDVFQQISFEAIEIPDLLGDSHVPAPSEAAARYTNDEALQNLETPCLACGVDERKYRVLVANIDGHLHLLHGSKGTECTEECMERTIQRLLIRDDFYISTGTEVADTTEVQEQLGVVLRQVFDVLRWGHPVSAAAQDVQAQHRLGRPPSMATDNVVSMSMNIRPLSHAELLAIHSAGARDHSDTLTLHISIVSAGSDPTSSATRFLPRLSLSAAVVPNLAALRARLEEYVRSSSDQSRGTGFDLIQVWLPDGLVRVQDDGEWMGALLKAEMVEWMDREVRVLVEI